MARRKRVKRRQARRGGRRWLTRLGIGLALAVPVLYFAFTKAFYDPFEDDQPPFPTLVPRDVDLFVRRVGLASDMEVFPRPALLDRLQRTRAYRDLAATTWWKGLSWPGEMEAALKEGEAAAAELPLDPLADLIGREVALVGRFPDGAARAARGAGAGGSGAAGEGGAGEGGAGEGAAGEGAGRTGGADAEPELLLMARISGKAKFSVEALDFGVLRSSALPDATFTEEEDPDVPGLTWRRLELPGEAPMHYARRADLLVVSASAGLLRDVLRAVDGSREASLGLSRLYIDSLPPPTGEPGMRLSLDAMVDARPLLRRAGFGAGAPPPPVVTGDPAQDAALAAVPGPDAMANALEKLFDLSLLREVVARIELDDTLTVRAFADVDHALATERHTGVVGAPGFLVDERLTAALRMLPGDTSGVVVLNVELRPFLHTIGAAVNTDVMGLLDAVLKDIVRYNPGWTVDDVNKLIDYLDRTLDGRLTFAVRPLDHEVPEGSQPLPLVALIAPVRDASRWVQLDQAVVRGHKALGLDREKMWQQDEGVGMRKWLGLPEGLPVEEVSYVLLDGATLVIGTDDAFVREIVAAYTSGRSSLNAKAPVRRLVDRFGKARGNVAGWISAEALRRLIDPYGEYVADLDTVFDRGVARLQQRQQLLQGEFREWAGREDKMPEATSKQLEARLDAYIEGLEAERRATQIPVLADAFRQRFQWLTLLDGVAFSIRIGERDAEMALFADTALSGR